MIDVAKVSERWEDEVSRLTHVKAFRAGVAWVEATATYEQARLVSYLDPKGGQPNDCPQSCAGTDGRTRCVLG